jgi:hypothetical protein
MGKDPAVLFYTSDFLTGTKLFSYEQKGRYIDMLCVQHQSGNIPSDDFEEMSDNDPKIAKKFLQDKKGNYYNERMLIETNKRKKYCASRRSNRLKSKIKPTKHMSDIYKTHVGHMENENRDEDKDIIKDKNINKINCNVCLTEYLLIRIQERRQLKVTPEKVKSWCNTFRIMRTSDKRKVVEIFTMIKECHDMIPRRGFTWADQILSPNGLRKKWNDGKIYIGMNENNKQPNQFNQKLSTKDLYEHNMNLDLE